MAWTRAAPAVAAALIFAAVAVSGGSPADPRTPSALPGLPPPFLGVAVVGSGGITAAIDAYGNVVDLRAPGPAGRTLIDNPIERQRAGTVAHDTGIVTRVALEGGEARALWEADWVRQRYLPATNVLRTEAGVGPVRVSIVDAALGDVFERRVSLSGASKENGRGDAAGSLHVDVPKALANGSGPEARVDCEKKQRDPRRVVLTCSGAARENSDASPAATDRESTRRRLLAHAGGAKGGQRRLAPQAVEEDHRWLAGARPLGSGAPQWARLLYARSLLVLRALADARTGAVAAGIRDGWAYVWPRDAGAVALALAAGGYRGQARQVARFLQSLDLTAAARFHGDGTPVPGRAAQGDAFGWAFAAAQAGGLTEEMSSTSPEGDGRSQMPQGKGEAPQWRGLADYQEKSPGDYLANAIASPGGQAIARLFGTPDGLVREARSERGAADGELDSAAAWAVRPFPHPTLFPLARRTLKKLLRERRNGFGIPPSEGWPEDDPWTAPTAWSAWSLAALGERRLAIELLGDLRRTATPAGLLPERVGALSGIPRSTTPLAWSHAFAVLALQELWPGA